MISKAETHVNTSFTENAVKIHSRQPTEMLTKNTYNSINTKKSIDKNIKNDLFYPIFVCDIRLSPFG